MSFVTESFDVSKIVVEKPALVKTKEGDSCILKIKYGGGEFSFFNKGAVKCTAVNENPKQPGKYSQGIYLETEALKKLAQEASKKILEEICKYSDHDNMTALGPFVRQWTSPDKIMALKEMGGNVKTLIHYPEKKDKAGKSTGEIDPEATPLMYGKLIQSGPNHETQPNTIFTKYWDASVLTPENDAAIKAQKKKDSDFAINPKDLIASKTAMKAMPSMVISDVYVAKGNCIIRIAVSEQYVTEFIAKESQGRKNLKAALLADGIVDIKSPGAMPTAASGSDGEDGHEEGPPPEEIQVGDGEFKLTVNDN